MSNPNSWVGTSRKMSKSLSEATAFATHFADADATSDPRIQRLVIPPFIAIGEVRRILAGTSVKVGAQNMHCAELITCPHIDGLFIGRSAWDVKGELNILNICATALNS